jgi:hypothetical protein
VQFETTLRAATGARSTRAEAFVGVYDKAVCDMNMLAIEALVFS